MGFRAYVGFWFHCSPNPHHAWLVENLDGRRVRILTQETQKGKPAEELHNAKPNPMINGHQDWLDSLVEAARKAKQA